MTAVDPETQQTTAIFHPRTDEWAEHYHFQGYKIVADSAVGRATAAALQFNHPRRVQIRQAEELFGLFPPS